MKDPKFGYNWIWIVPFYYIAQLYFYVLEKVFPKKFKKIMEIKNDRSASGY